MVKRIILKTLKIIGAVLASLIIIILVAHGIGRIVNNQTPAGGINESMYVDINGTKQWINIYGEDKNNPVLLYLHGGPGAATSTADYPVLRKWADVYTVVTWDQRNSGKSYDKTYDTAFTYDMLMTDGKEMTEYLLSYLNKSKITLLGHSWGSLYGANLALAYPEYYDCLIGTGQYVDNMEDEIAFQEAAAKWVVGDEESIKLLEELKNSDKFDEHYYDIRNQIATKYGHNEFANDYGIDLITTVLFNPYYSISDWIQYLQFDRSIFSAFVASEEFQRFSLKDRYDYEMPFYNINGDNDYNTVFTLSAAYFEKVNAPYKKLYMMEGTTHFLLFAKPELFSQYIHEIAKEQNAN